MVSRQVQAEPVERALSAQTQYLDRCPAHCVVENDVAVAAARSGIEPGNQRRFRDCRVDEHHPRASVVVHVGGRRGNEEVLLHVRDGGRHGEEFTAEAAHVHAWRQNPIGW